MNLYLDMFISFFKVGLFTFGGGYAMIPIAKKEFVDSRGWISESELIDYYAISQVSIGIITINTNVLIGYHTAKKKGALVAAIATVLPSIIIIITIASLLEGFFEYEFVINMFKAIRIVVSALIVNTTIRLVKMGVFDFFGLIVFPLSLLLIILFNINPIILVIGSAFAGIFFYPRKRGEKS
jgi:chromate transporter